MLHDKTTVVEGSVTLTGTAVAFNNDGLGIKEATTIGSRECCRVLLCLTLVVQCTFDVDRELAPRRFVAVVELTCIQNNVTFFLLKVVSE